MSEARLSPGQMRLVEHATKIIQLSQAMDLVIMGNRITVKLIDQLYELMTGLNEDFGLPDEIVEQVVGMRTFVANFSAVIARCAKAVEGEE